MNKTQKKATPKSALRKALESALPQHVTRDELAMIDRADAEAERLFLQIALGGTHVDDPLEVTGRIAHAAAPELEAELEALDTCLQQEVTSRDGVLTDGVPGHIMYLYGKAGYFLGLAVGRRMAGAR